MFCFTLVTNLVGNRSHTQVGRKIGNYQVSKYMVYTYVMAVFTTYLLITCLGLISRQVVKKKQLANHHGQLMNWNTTENCSQIIYHPSFMVLWWVLVVNFSSKYRKLRRKSLAMNECSINLCICVHSLINPLLANLCFSCNFLHEKTPQKRGLQTINPKFCTQKGSFPNPPLLWGKGSQEELRIGR